MEIRELLGRLQGVSGPSASGEYSAKCPVHDDKTASLTVRQKTSDKDGKDRIYICCHAHCPNSAIMAALGITARDLIVNPDPPRASGGSGRTRGRSERSGASGSGRSGEDAPADAPTDAPTDADVPWDERAGDGEVIQGVRVHTVKNEGSAIRAGGSGANGTGSEADGNGRGSGSGRNGSAANGSGANGTGSEADGSGAGGSGSAANGNGRGSGAGGNGSAAGGSGTGGAAKPQQNGAGAAKTQREEIDYQHPDAVYSYTDAEGKELFQVVRYHYIGKSGKTFRQRIYDPGNAKANRDGYVGSVPAELRDRTLYRMPRIRQAIAEGKPVYVVEGEKDVETLERLGYAATCNPGGAGKWKTGHSEPLRGADVIILPDCDTAGNAYAGQNHAYDVALKLRDAAKRVRLVDLKEACPTIPEKGDISDMVAQLGEVEAMDALARQVAATRDFDPQAVPFWLTPQEQAERLYSAVEGYAVESGSIVQKHGSETKPLCDFYVIPRMELTRDDGVSTSLHFVMDGWNARGWKLGRVVISAADLDGMAWVTGKWGFDASLAPGSTTKQKVAWAIKKVGQMTAKKVTEYNHTGWRKIEGKWCYLYQGGAVGMEGVTVDMGESSLKTYRLDGSGAEGFDRITFREGAAHSLRIQQIMKEEIGIALLGTVYLAPLREFLRMSDIVPAFSLYLYGESGTHKTTAAALAMSHYGNFHGKNSPASFNDTASSIRSKAFLVKDAPVLVDDFHPTSSVMEKRQMSAVAQSLSRAFGDGSDRGRLNSDRTLQAEKPPRSVAIITGEDLPAIGASGLARFFILDIDKEDIPLGAEITAEQEAARAGYLQKAMRGYIIWLSKQTDKLPDRLHDMFVKFREDIRQQADGQHDRAPEAIACILVGYMHMLQYFQAVELISAEQVGTMMLHARKTLLEAGLHQAREMESEKPTRIFLDGLSELLTSKRVMLKDLSAEEVREPGPMDTMIGYMDRDFYYLLPQVAFGAVSRLCREQGTEFPVSLKALFKHMRTDGILKLPPGEKDMTRVKRVDGGTKRLLWIPVELMQGPRPEIEQLRMKGYTEVNPAENPF